MSSVNNIMARAWTRVGPQFMPFADAASADLPLGRLLRLSLFQVSVGMAMALMVGTLNRVMIVELGISAWIVAVAVALPLVFAPFRALIGFKSDHHRSYLGWRRVPYLWFGTLLQFGGLSIMPFALLILSGDTTGPLWIGHVASALSFLLVGAGMQTTQTAGLALATDLAPVETRPRVVALMYVMLLVGMVGSGFIFGLLLRDFNEVKLIQVVQGAASLTLAFNIVALWKQEARDPNRTRHSQTSPAFGTSWRAFARTSRAKRFLVAVCLGTAAFSMQDIVLEPYGAEVLGLSVSETTSLTVLLAGGALAAYALAARMLAAGLDPYRLAGYGALTGLPAFALVIASGPLNAPILFGSGVALVGFGGGLFSVATLVAAMGLEEKGSHGLALGAWGAAHATAAGLAMSCGGLIRDGVGSLAQSGALGQVLNNTWAGYSAVYHIEVALLFATLIAIGPLARLARRDRSQAGLGLAEIPR
jgi:BCD family chlorophyll transporter-like MFS transporter